MWSLVLILLAAVDPAAHWTNAVTPPTNFYQVWPVNPCTVCNCDDGNVNTTDSCDPATGCSNMLMTCDDSNACTTDTGTPPSCSHAAITCNDGKACTTDTCNTATGCVFTPTYAGCCTVVADCNDGNVCTTDTCSGAPKRCTNAQNAVACDLDSSMCTVDMCGGAAGGGNCGFTAMLSCVDHVWCTTDPACVPATGCTHGSKTGIQCGTYSTSGKCYCRSDNTCKRDAASSTNCGTGAYAE